MTVPYSYSKFPVPGSFVLSALSRGRQAGAWLACPDGVDLRSRIAGAIPQSIVGRTAEACPCACSLTIEGDHLTHKGMWLETNHPTSERADNRPAHEECEANAYRH